MGDFQRTIADQYALYVYAYVYVLSRGYVIEKLRIGEFRIPNFTLTAGILQFSLPIVCL